MPLYRVVSGSPSQPHYFGLKPNITPSTLSDNISIAIIRTQECSYNPNFLNFLKFNQLAHAQKKADQAVLIQQQILSEMRLHPDFFSNLRIKLKQLESSLLEFHKRLAEERQKIQEGIQVHVKSKIDERKQKVKIGMAELVARQTEYFPFNEASVRSQAAEEYWQKHLEIQTDYTHEKIRTAHGIVSHVRSTQAEYDVVIMLYAYIAYFRSSAVRYVSFAKGASSRTTRTTTDLFNSLRSTILPKFSSVLSHNVHRDMFMRMLEESTAEVYAAQSARTGKLSEPYGHPMEEDFSLYIQFVIERTRQLAERYRIDIEFVDKLVLPKIQRELDESYIARDAIVLATDTASDAAAKAIASLTAIPPPFPPNPDEVERFKSTSRQLEAAIHEAQRSPELQQKRINALKAWLRDAPWENLFTSEILERDIRTLIDAFKDWLPEHSFGRAVGSSPLVANLRRYEDEWRRQILAAVCKQKINMSESEKLKIFDDNARFSHRINTLQEVLLTLFNLLFHLKKTQAFTITGQELPLYR